MNPFRYTARESDAETGLYYYRARYYDPTTGRFLTEDPAGFMSGINKYQYVDNSPVLFRDPSGLCPSGLSKDQIIARARKSLLSALLDDTDCINFLAGRGADALNVLKNISIAPGDLGYYRFTAQTFNADRTVDGKAPTNPYIVINNQGFFFTSPNAIGFQGANLLHELGHATGVLVPDGVPNDPAATAKLQAHNDEALKTNCAKALQTLGKP